MRLRKRECSHIHLVPSNQLVILLLFCVLNGRNFFIIAVAAAASPFVSGRYRAKWSLPLTPWTSVDGPNLDPSASSSDGWWRRIGTLLSDHSIFGIPKSSLFGALRVRGGGSNPNIDFSDFDDDVPAEDILDAIFDDDDSAKKRQKKIHKAKPNPKEEKLQHSIKQKATSSVDDTLLDLDSLLESTSSERKLSTKQSKARSSSQQKKTTGVGRELTPKLERRTRSSSSTPVSKRPNSNISFRDETDRLGKIPIPLKQGKKDQPKMNILRQDAEKVVSRGNTSNTAEEELLVGSITSRNMREDGQRTKQLDEQQKKHASPEPLATHQIRAAPTVSTQSTQTKISSPAFVRRKSPSSNSEANSPTASRHHAVWGPDARHRKTKPGPPPTKATEDERRAHQSQNRIRKERKKLLSDLAIRMNDSHTSAVRALIRGSAAHIPPELFGQTIMQEKSACNEKFYGSVTEVGGTAAADSTVLGEEIDAAAPSFRHIEDPTLLSYWGLTPHAKLYGGAQYHRVLRYYHHMFLTVPLPPITDDEVALLTNGITEVHDASDLMRAVALLVRQKMEIVMEDVLADMTRRLLYVLDRHWEMVEYSMALHRPMGGANGLGKSGDKVLNEAEFLNRYGIEYNAAETGLKNVLSTGFHKFAREKAELAHRQSLEDIQSLLRYVTWDMGRARKRVPQNKNNQGFVSQIEIVGREASSDESNGDQAIDSEKQLNKKDGKPRQKKQKPSHPVKLSGTSERIMARGGAVGSGRKRSRRWNEKEKCRSQGLQKGVEGENEYDEDEMGDLIGGVMNRGKLDDSDIENSPSPNQSMVISSKSSPLFSGDDEVLSVLLATVSSTLAPKSEIQHGHTQAAIESLVHYVTDRMRMDISRMIRSKFNSFFLLAFYEDLGPYLSREIHSYLSSME